MSDATDALPLPSIRIWAIGSTLANGGTPDLSGLSLADLRDCWAVASFLVALRRRRNEAQPQPRRRGLTRGEAERFACELMRIPTPGEILLGILEEPLVLAILAMVQAPVLRHEVPPATPTPGGPRGGP